MNSSSVSTFTRLQVDRFKSRTDLYDNLKLFLVYLTMEPFSQKVRFMGVSKSSDILLLRLL